MANCYLCPVPKVLDLSQTRADDTARTLVQLLHNAMVTHMEDKDVQVGKVFF